MATVKKVEKKYMKKAEPESSSKIFKKHSKALVVGHYFMGRLNPPHKGHINAILQAIIHSRENNTTPLILLGNGPALKEHKTTHVGRATQIIDESFDMLDNPISFDLKDIDITARKSILTVSVRNSGSDDFKISPDDICLAEGNKRIQDASLRSEFDSLTVKPNEEVKGKITILGKPWNDRLTINMSDGTTTVSLRRR